MADVPQTTGYEPTCLAENDDLCVKPLFFHRLSITSTFDSAESTATLPPESDLGDEQRRNMLSSPLCCADGSRIYHSCRENSVSGSSHLPESAEKSAAVLSHERKSNQETRPTEKAFPRNINQFKEKTKATIQEMTSQMVQD